MENEQLNDIQTRIAQLQEKGWTIAAIADELEVTTNAVEKWKAGDRNPSNQKATLAFLDKLLERKRIPKKRRYSKGNKKAGDNDGL
jgi:transcriptional regulator with XRE-family HTH domain